MSPRKRAQPVGAGLPGTASPNRTDLAVQTPTGLPYGEAGQLQAAQRAVPMPAAPGIPAPVPGAAQAGATPPPAAGPGTLGGGSVPPPPGGAPSLEDILAAASRMAPPSSSMSGPSERPNEPVTAGLPSGPGPGPEILGINQPGTSTLAQTLQAAAQASGSGLLANLAAQAAQARA